MIKAVLFDLDGTLLPMDNDIFTKGYFKLLAKYLMPYGYDANKLVESIMASLQAMVLDDTDASNEEVFWRAFNKTYGKDCKKDIDIFEQFYINEFYQAKQFCGYNQSAVDVVKKLKEMDLRVTLATNPIFPQIATKQRIEWAGFKEEDFEFYTTYENSKSCKPQLQYYKDVCNQLGVSPEECIMVGNDALEDMIASKLGMKVFLITDCLLNKKNVDISNYPQGTFEDLLTYIQSIK